MNTDRGVAAIGDVTDIQCLSGSPYYFYTSGKQMGLFSQPWMLDMNRFQIARFVWNIKNYLRGNGIGGYQFSKAFLCKAEAEIPKAYFSSEIVSFNQMFPRASSVVKNGGKVYYYIDATLHDLFVEKSYNIQVSDAVKKEALLQERENYQLAEAVITMGSWIHETLKDLYGVPASKIHQILPGANLIIQNQFQPEMRPPAPGISRDLVLGFIGKDWKRKGLPLLLDVRDELASRGYRVMVKAIGNCPDELLSRKGLTYTGFINKQTSTSEFIEIISSCDIGCLFSESEALGISILEFLRVGVPVAGFSHQGLKETLLPGASLKFDIMATVPMIADSFEKFILDSQLQSDLKNGAIQYSGKVTWAECINSFKRVLKVE